MGSVEEKDPLVGSIGGGGQDDEFDDHWRSYDPRSQLHRQKHQKLWNAACLIFGVLIGAIGLLVIQEVASRPLDFRLTKSPNAARLQGNRLPTLCALG